MSSSDNTLNGRDSLDESFYGFEEHEIEPTEVPVVPDVVRDIASGEDKETDMETTDLESDISNITEGEERPYRRFSKRKRNPRKVLTYDDLGVPRIKRYNLHL